MQILLAIVVFVSLLLIFTLLFLVIRRKEQLFSKTAFERLKSFKRAKKSFVVFFFLVLGVFILHEIIEIIPGSHSHRNFIGSFHEARHFFIYIFLVIFQSIGVYLTLKLTKDCDDIR